MTAIPLTRAERDAVLERAAFILADQLSEEFQARLRAAQSVPIGTAAALLGCSTRTLERHCEVFCTGQRDKSITLDELEAFRARFTSRRHPASA